MYLKRAKIARGPKTLLNVEKIFSMFMWIVDIFRFNMNNLGHKPIHCGKMGKWCLTFYISFSFGSCERDFSAMCLKLQFFFAAPHFLRFVDTGLLQWKKDDQHLRVAKHLCHLGLAPCWVNLRHRFYFDLLLDHH